ncbi:MAG: efflux transporter, family, subunit [Phenylobacterium sp.]|nr:efflux transporter, family, subunit [Phenylobacterium sp.]
MKMETVAGVDAVPLKRRRLPPRGWLVLAAALVIGTGGVVYLRAAKGSVSTDNAYLKSDVTIVAPRVRGHVAEVLVAENQPVAAGQVLIRLDPEEYAARVAAARGDLAIADAAIGQAQAALTHLQSEAALAAASVHEAETGIRASDAQAARAEADRQRYTTLVRTGFVPRRDAERVDADAASAAAAAERSRATLAVSRSQEAVTRDRRGELTAAISQARAGREKGQAALDLALQDQEHAAIRAPIAGVVGDRQANVGDFVQPGSRLLTIVPMDRLYVTANFKETQTARMLRGQAAKVQVDALPGVTLKAHVESFAPGSGSEFALLPFEPGVGNFTKIVQRVPVRLRFDAGQPEVSKLRPGLSAKVTVALSGKG